MKIPVDKLTRAFKMGASVKHSQGPIRRCASPVYRGCDRHPFLIETVRDAFVPQTTSALVRVERLGSLPEQPPSPIPTSPSCSPAAAPVAGAVQELVVCGPPVVVLAESSVEVPFIERDSRMLGLVAATDKVHLLASLARWILERTDKQTAFAANFLFMRIAAAIRIIASTSLGNLATGALFFLPGADFPVMTLAQLGMMLRLAAVFGKRPCVPSAPMRSAGDPRRRPAPCARGPRLVKQTPASRVCRSQGPHRGRGTYAMGAPWPGGTSAMSATTARIDSSAPRAPRHA